jgi:hypothetical protein
MNLKIFFSLAIIALISLSNVVAPPPQKKPTAANFQPSPSSGPTSGPRERPKGLCMFCGNCCNWKSV